MTEKIFFLQLYNFLVNKHAGIRERYHHVHDGTHGLAKLISWLYLLWLNLCYYVFFCKFLGRPKEIEFYEEKRLMLYKSESQAAMQKHLSVEEMVEKLSSYDIISFDIFDTLIFRPFSEPTAVFYFMGEELGILDFKRIRMEIETKSRQESYKKNGHYEINLHDIWESMEKEIGIPAEQGEMIECATEEKFCYANPFMLEVFHRLQALGKKIIVVSDMYLPKKFLSDLLKKNGFIEISKMYLSCEYGKSKADGMLYQIVKNDCAGKFVVHVGDNEHSDVYMAEKRGIHSIAYPNVNKMALSFRPYDMSPIIGSAYRGIVDNWLYQGKSAFSLEYEYGFIYGGLFVLGYCSFIHEYCEKNKADKILFLSRDGDILKQIYDKMYPEDDTSYVYWSRAAATKLMAPYNKYDYFRRYLYHKVNQRIAIRDILRSMELDPLIEALSDQSNDISKELKLSLDEFLTDKNVKRLHGFLQKYFDLVVECYRDQGEAAKEYYAEQLTGCKKACAVDIGWAGSGAVSLSYLVEKVWKLPCILVGMVAGTNTVHNVEPDASESFLLSGRLVSYLFSQGHNRDLMKKHDINKKYNVFWELLLSSPTKQFLGFGYETNGQEKNKKVVFRFGKSDINQEGICDIQRGIHDFTKEYICHFKNFPCMFHISGRDAAAPMLLASSYKEKFLKVVEARFCVELGVS